MSLVWNATETPVLPQEDIEVEEKTQEKVQHALPWKVIVLDDPVNLQSYVVFVFRRVFGYEQEKAHKHMLEVHELGRSTLWSGEREQAEFYQMQLQKAHLQVILQQESAE